MPWFNSPLQPSVVVQVVTFDKEVPVLRSKMFRVIFVRHKPTFSSKHLFQLLYPRVLSVKKNQETNRYTYFQLIIQFIIWSLRLVLALFRSSSRTLSPTSLRQRGVARSNQLTLVSCQLKPFAEYTTASPWDISSEMSHQKISVQIA